MSKDELTGKVIGAAIEVHRALGPGLLESAYQQCLARELELRGIGVVRIQLTTWKCPECGRWTGGRT